MGISGKSALFWGVVGGISSIWGTDYYLYRNERESLLEAARKIALRPMAVTEEPKRIKILVNEKTDPDVFYSYVRDILNAAYCEYEIIESNSPGDAHIFVREKLDSDHCDGVVAIGTSILFEVLSSAAEKSLQLPIGYIPSWKRAGIYRIYDYFNDRERMRIYGDAALRIAESNSVIADVEKLDNIITEINSPSVDDLLNLTERLENSPLKSYKWLVYI